MMLFSFRRLLVILCVAGLCQNMMSVSADAGLFKKKPAPAVPVAAVATATTGSSAPVAALVTAATAVSKPIEVPVKTKAKKVKKVKAPKANAQPVAVVATATTAQAKAVEVPAAPQKVEPSAPAVIQQSVPDVSQTPVPNPTAQPLPVPVVQTPPVVEPAKEQAPAPAIATSTTTAAAPAVADLAANKELEELDFANGLFQRGLYEMAQSEYDQFIKKYPQSANLPQAYFGRAESQFFLLTYATAIESYQKYLETAPSGTEASIAKIRLGYCLVFNNQPTEALNYLQKVDVNSVNPSFQQLLYYSLGRAYESISNISKAMEFFYKATEITPKTNYTVLSYLQMGDMMLNQKEYNRATGFFATAEKEGLTDEQKAIALFKQGQAQLQLGDLSKSIEYFEKVLQNYEHEEIAVDAFYQMLWVYNNLKQPSAVIDSYQKYKQLVTDDAKFINIQHLVVDAKAQMKDYTDALAMIDKDIAASTTDKDAYRRNLIKKAQLLSQAERYEEALKIIEENIQSLTEAKDQALMLQAEAYYGLKDYAKAFSLYEQVKNEFPNTLAADQAAYGMAFAKNSAGELKEAVALFNDYFTNGKDQNNRQKALYNATLLNIKLDLLDNAIASGQSYLATFPSGEYAQKVLYLLGTIHSKLQHYEQAIEIFTRFVITYPQSEQLGEVYFALAYQLQSSGKLDQAQMYYEKAVKVDDDNKERRYASLKNLAAIYLNKNEFAKAADIIEKMVSNYKENDLEATSYLWLAEYYVKQQKTDDVLRVLEAAQNNPHVKDETGGINYFLAEGYRQKGDNDKALQAYDKVLDLKTPTVYLAEAKIGKAMVLIQKGSFDEAKKLLSEAIESSEDNTLAMKARFALGELEEKQGHPEEAVKYFMLVAVLYQNADYSSQALFKAGGLLETQGKKEEARKAYQEIVQGYPQSPLFQQAKQRIEVLSGQ